MNSPSGSPVDYTWTAKAQLKDISRDGPPPLATYTYDKAGRLDLLAHENTISEDLTHDNAGQLLSRIHKKSGTPVSGHGYAIDTTGRRTAETFSDGTTPARTYGYDTTDQVTSATYGGGQSDAYNYDAMGNRTSATLAINSGATTTYTANNVNQYTAISGFSAPIHDPNGNLTFQNGITYTWDSENRLLSITDGTTTNTFTYDGHHRRVTKRTTVSGIVTQKVHYLYDGWNVIEERTNYDSATTFNLSTFSLTRTLTWGTDLSGSLQGVGGVGGLLMAEEITSTTTTAYHYHYDGNGNVTEVTDSTGNPAATYRYDAFGNTLVSTGTYAATNKYRFSTKPIDEEITSTPLYYYGYRYYDSVTGRWPSRDPIGEKGGINIYGFIGNNGVSLIDKLGLSEFIGNPFSKETGRGKPGEIRNHTKYSYGRMELVGGHSTTVQCAGTAQFNLSVSVTVALAAQLKIPLGKLEAQFGATISAAASSGQATTIGLPDCTKGPPCDGRFDATPYVVIFVADHFESYDYYREEMKIPNSDFTNFSVIPGQWIFYNNYIDTSIVGVEWVWKIENASGACCKHSATEVQTINEEKWREMKLAKTGKFIHK
jgi:RHS repeat-associated protein